MSFAEELRNENELPAEYKKSILSTIKNQFKLYGYFEIICDDHIGELSNHAVPSKYRESLIAYGKELGFRISYSHNTYGVRYIEFH